MRLRLGWLVVSTLAACSPDARTGSNATPDARPALTGDAASTLCYQPSVSGNVMPGVANIQDCAIWNSLSSMTGVVTLMRDQTGLSMAFASGITYTGTVINNNVALSYYALHTFEDGCLWRATETLTGPLDPTSCVMTLAYQYVETVETSNGACATPCSGTSNFTLQIDPIID